MMFDVFTSSTYLAFISDFPARRPQTGMGMGGSLQSAWNNKSEQNNEKSLVESSNIPIYYYSSQI
ncbi:hypothetical protein KY290_018554 [Solanum tuberosum]|uniref:Uncharacterized protein n=1 Tax=Solanum tuberosum TaxID=4113 RepID=A0ABQ7VEU7_SOLTU|nr:hypothetical protein KY289_017672 [Solanum tuberosum]KAH0762481.1 hypothetical protein KY290_018554 [Solanum tuberosum]